MQPRDLELLARLVGAPALDRVADRARQPLPVDLALDQVVLRAGGDGLDAAPLVVEPGEHEHRQVGAVGLEPVQRREPVRVGQVEVQQHAVDLVELLAPRLRERLRAHDLDERAADGEQLLDEQRVAVVVLDEQDANRRRGRRGIARSRVDGLRRTQVVSGGRLRRVPHCTHVRGGSKHIGSARDEGRSGGDDRRCRRNARAGGARRGAADHPGPLAVGDVRRQRRRDAAAGLARRGGGRRALAPAGRHRLLRRADDVLDLPGAARRARRRRPRRPRRALPGGERRPPASRPPRSAPGWRGGARDRLGRHDRARLARGATRATASACALRGRAARSW